KSKAGGGQGKAGGGKNKAGDLGAWLNSLSREELLAISAIRSSRTTIGDVGSSFGRRPLLLTFRPSALGGSTCCRPKRPSANTRQPRNTDTWKGRRPGITPAGCATSPR